MNSQVFSLFLVLLVPGAILDHTIDDNKLLVILLGGVRWDSDELPGFHRMASNGVKAEYLEPVFPAMTIPNLYTIMTGLYPRSHGQTGDYMYDHEKNLSFSKLHDPLVDASPLWWENGDPFWINIVRQKRKAYLYRWPGCDFYIHGIKPTYCKPIGDWKISKEEFTHSLSDSLNLFRNDTADLVAVYYNGLEDDTYNWGHSARLKNAFEYIDDVIANFQIKMEKTKLSHDVTRHLSDIINVVIISDHGFTMISPNRVIDMTSRLMTPSISHVIYDRSVIQIWPQHDALEMVFSSLNASEHHFTSYSLGHMPDSWHYMRGPFVAPIVLVAEPGYIFLTPKSPEFPTFTKEGKDIPLAGASGYINSHKDMRGIFYARGPHFKTGQKHKGFSSVHLYQVMCAILGVDMSSNDGSWSEISDMLVSTHVPHPYSYPTHRHRLVTTLIVITLLFCLVSGACALYYRRHSIRKWYQYRSIQWQPLHDGVI